MADRAMTLAALNACLCGTREYDTLQAERAREAARIGDGTAPAN